MGYDNNGPVLLFRTIFRLIYHLFSSLKAMPAKITQKRSFGQCSLIQFVQISVFATCTCPIMHLIYPPKFCVSIVFNFSWHGCNTQEK